MSNPSTHTTIGNVIILRTPICGSRCVNYSAWQMPVDGEWPRHGTIMSFDGVVGHCGRIGTDPLLPSLDALPARSEERYTKVMAFINANRDRAYALIVQAHPELATTGTRDMGEIEVWTEQAK